MAKNTCDVCGKQNPSVRQDPAQFARDFQPGRRSRKYDQLLYDRCEDCRAANRQPSLPQK